MPPGGGLTPWELAQEFGTRTQFRLGGLSIVHNRQTSGNVWFALHVTEIVGDTRYALGLDAHVTLLYLGSYQDHADAVATAMTGLLQQILARRGTFSADFLTAGSVSPFSNRGYGMIDLLVTSQAHGTLHRLANQGLSALPVRRQAYIHPAFHLSFRRSATAVFVDAPQQRARLLA